MYTNTHHTVPRDGHMSVPRTSSWFGVGGGGGQGTALAPPTAVAFRRARPSSRSSFIGPNRTLGSGGASTADGSFLAPRRSYDNPTTEQRIARDRRASVIVEVATELGIREEERGRKTAEVISFARQNGQGGMEALSFAIRKRLKNPDETIVLNCLGLLEELMRSVPFFFRACANDKFFRRLWRFVVPNYKEGYRGKLHLGRSGYDARTRGARHEPAERVQILLRAWAEELRRIYAGQFDISARFFIDRYANKRVKYNFPPVPPSDRPWIYDVAAERAASSSSRSRSSQRAYAGSVASNAPPPDKVPLSEIENTANLFDNMVEKASSADELREDTFAILAQRCKTHLDDISRMTLNMDKEDDLARSVKVSEQLQKTLTIYNKAIATGHIERPIPIVSNDENPSDQGEDGYHKYHESPPRSGEARGAAGLPRSQEEEYSDSSEEKYHTASSPPPEPAPQKTKRKVSPPTGGERDTKSGKKKVIVRKKKAAAVTANANGSASSSSRPTVRKKKKVLPKKKNGEKKEAEAQKQETLVSITKEENQDSDGDIQDRGGDAFEMLADREHQKAQSMYSTQNTSTSTEVVEASLAPQLQQASIEGQQQLQQSQQSPAQQTYNPYMPPVSNTPYGAVMVVPPANPLGLYGSMNPAMVAPAYQPINPAMYYGSVNPSVGAQANQTQSGEVPASTAQSSQMPSSTAAPSNGAQRTQLPPGPVPTFGVPFFPPQLVPATVQQPASVSGQLVPQKAQEVDQAQPSSQPLSVAASHPAGPSGASATSTQHQIGQAIYNSYPGGIASPSAYNAVPGVQSADPYQNAMMMNAAAAYHFAAQQQAAAYAAYQSVNPTQALPQASNQGTPPLQHASATPAPQNQLSPALLQQLPPPLQLVHSPRTPQLQEKQQPLPPSLPQVAQSSTPLSPRKAPEQVPGSPIQPGASKAQHAKLA